MRGIREVNILCFSAGSIRKCKIDDETCLRETANEVIRKQFLGVSELGLESVDPLKIKKMNIVQGGGNSSVQIDLKFREVELLGLKNAEFYKVAGFKADPEKNKLEFNFKTKLATIMGPYTINGKMVILPIMGNGTIILNLQNLDVHLKFLTKKVMRNGKIFMNIEKSKFTYDLTGANVNFSNLFDGNKDLGDNMNMFLNANWKLLLDELSKPISISFAKAFKELLNSIFDRTPYEEFFER